MCPVMKRVSVLIIQRQDLSALRTVGVFYCSPLSCSELDHHYHVALTAHGYEISAGPGGRRCVLLNE